MQRRPTEAFSGNVFVVVQSVSHVQLFVTPWTAACQASLSFTISQSFLKLMSLEFEFAQIHVPQIHVTWNISGEISPLIPSLFFFLSFICEKPISEPMHFLL